MKRRLALLLAVLVPLVACDEARPVRTPAPPPAARKTAEGPHAGIAISSAPAPALLFFDGRFVGQTSTLGPIEIVDAAGRHQIRLSEAGRLDFVRDVELAAGTMIDLRGELPGPDGPFESPAEILLGVGQPVRALLKGDEPLVYVVTDDFVPRRMLVVTTGSPTFRVFGPDGREIAVTKMAQRPAGTPGNVFHEYEGKVPGRYRIEVRGRNRAAWRFVQALPPLTKSSEPRLKGRRDPPIRPEER